MSQSLKACVSSLRAPRVVWTTMRPSRNEVWGEAQLLSCSLNTGGNHCQINIDCGFVERKGMTNYQLNSLSWSCFSCFF